MQTILLERYKVKRQRIANLQIHYVTVAVSETANDGCAYCLSLFMTTMDDNLFRLYAVISS
jgi:hypothetical protein